MELGRGLIPTVPIVLVAFHRNLEDFFRRFIRCLDDPRNATLLEDSDIIVVIWR